MAGHEPGRFVADTQLAGQMLPGKIPLAAKQVNGIEPQIQRDLRTLIECADGHAEGFTAGIAPMDPGTSRFALESGGPAGDFAMRANRTVTPQ